MPAWDDDDRLTQDPQNEISLIYYDNRGGLEDRVFRIKTDRSSATSLPDPRTGHNITDIEVLANDGDQVEVRFNWFTLYLPIPTRRIRTSARAYYTMDLSGPQPVILKKKVVLKNDYIHHVVDVYML
jgi:benzoate/toluate 1,2-dioxygenase beta subunit